jgi:capsular polysaccharide biosynthesis protein
VLRARWALILLTSACALAGAYSTRPTTLTYRAQATIYVGSRDAGVDGFGRTQNVGTERLARTIAALVRTPSTLREAIARTRVDRRPGAATAATLAGVVPGTTLVRIVCIDRDASVAQQLANGLADVLVAKVGPLAAGPGQPGDEPTLPVYVFERAQVPVSPTVPAQGGRLALAALFGLMVATAGCLLLTRAGALIDDQMEDLEQRTGLAVLARVPRASSVAPLGVTARRTAR